MERLTEWSYLAGVIVGDLKTGVDERKAFDRLAAYEDTGLEPEDVTSLMASHGTAILALSEYRSIGSVGRFKKFSQAEKDGRLVVLPCKVGDLMYEIDLPEYGIITCKVLEIHTYFGPFLHAPGNPMVSTATVSVEIIDGHGKGSGYTFETPEFGKTVFLTREEAEAALKKREEKREDET